MTPQQFSACSDEEITIDGVVFRVMIASPGFAFPPKNAPEGMNLVVLEHLQTGHLFLRLSVDRSGMWGAGLWHLYGELDESWMMRLDQLVRVKDVPGYVQRLIEQQE
jgi:hypothetical protein